MHRIEQVDSEKSFICKETETLLTGMERAGVSMFPIGCRGGGCGICKIKIIEGEVEKEIMSRIHVTQDEEKSEKGLRMTRLTQSFRFHSKKISIYLNLRSRKV